MLRRGGVAALGAALVLASCAGVKERVGGWFGAKAPASAPGATAAQAPRVYYAGVDGLKVHSEPSASSKVVGTLTLHEERAAKAIGSPVDLAVRARTDVLVTRWKYRSVGDAQMSPNGDTMPAPDAQSP
jgi:hypothetical protein